MSEVLGFEFLPDNVRPFSVFNIVQSLTIFTFLSFEAFVDTRTELYVFHSICGIAGIVMCSCTLWFPYSNKQMPKQASEY